MGLESATYVSDLVTSNPVGATDLKSQGDDHLRLIKSALQATFPNASKAFYFPDTEAKSTAFSIAATDLNKIFLVTTTSADVVATLPSLVSGDAGWRCGIMKVTSDTNAIFITPPSGTIASGAVTGLAKTRRCINHVVSWVFWTGSSWIASRAVDVPVGTILNYDGASLPVGYEWPNGQTLSGTTSSLYPDYYAVKSSLVTADHRGRVTIGKDDMGGSAASRITNAKSGITGTTLQAAGGTEDVTQVQANLPNVTLSATGSVAVDTTFGGQALVPNTGTGGTTINYATGGGGVSFYQVGQFTQLRATFSAGVTESLNGGVTQTAMRNVQPSIVENKILVVE